MSKIENEKDIARDVDVTVLPATQQVGYDIERTEAEAILAETHEGEFGTKRDLTPRHVSMIAIAGTIGTGLFLGSGSALVLGGPVGCFLAYLIMGVLVGCMMLCLGEMICFSPDIGGFIGMGKRYVDPAFGFMLGINYVLGNGMTVPSEITAVGVLISYWDDNANHVSIYIAVFLVIVVAMNVVGVKYFGEIEFWFACVKVTTLVGLIIFGLVVDLGGAPNKEFIGGRYWREEPFNDTYLGLSNVNLARFLGFWGVFTKAAFSYGGVEAISVIAGEAHNPRKTMKMAVRTVFYRIVGIYTLSILIIGLCVSQNSPLLQDAVALGGATAASSPFVVMCAQTGVNVLPSIINAIVMTSALSTGNEATYAVARTLLALSRDNSMPKIFRKTSKAGVPLAGIAVAFAFGLLAFLSVSAGSNQAFTWLSNLTALSSLISWWGICVCYVRFRGALKAQGIDRANLPFRSRGQPYVAWACIIFFTLVLLFNGFPVFIGGFDLSDFFADYVTIPVVILAYAGWKIVKRTKLVPLDEVDLSGGPYETLQGTKYDAAHMRMSA